MKILIYKILAFTLPDYPKNNEIVIEKGLGSIIAFFVWADISLEASSAEQNLIAHHVLRFTHSKKTPVAWLAVINASVQ